MSDKLPPDPFDEILTCWNQFRNQYDPDFDWVGVVYCGLLEGHEGIHLGCTPHGKPRSWQSLHGVPFTKGY